MEKELKAKPLIRELYQELAEKTAGYARKPLLTVLILGEDPAAEFYIANIEKKGKKAGIDTAIKRMSIDTKQDELISILKELNSDPLVNAIMVQKPLPPHIDDNLIAAAINPQKDVDGFNPVNLGKMLLETDSLLPSTPAAVMEMIRYYGIELSSKHTVLCGRSHIVGKPLLNLLINKQQPGNATVTVCHSRTKDLAVHTLRADILITAMGIARFIKSEMVRDGVIILDVGTNEIIEEGKTSYTGDVDYEACYAKAAAITPVPGGIGSVTTAMLLKNVVKAYEWQQ
jgi:methylenetetrahydrofolate dehydrogenase (NADP+)/methenyltetrahydrofolate cyclohydrolase